MSGDEPRLYAHAYLRVRARDDGSLGDAAIAELPFAPDLIRARGFVFDEGVVVKRPIATRGTQIVAPDQLDDAISSFVEELQPHTAALRRLRDRVRMRLTVVADTEGPWLVRLMPETIAWLTEIDAALWIDAFVRAPEGTEHGAVCTYCKLERPATDREELVDLLGGYGPHHGIADCRLVVCSLDYPAIKRIFRRWPYLVAQLDDLNVLVLAGKPRPTTVRHDGAVAVPVLLRRLRRHAAVRQALRTGNPTAVEVRARHWTARYHAGAWLRRRDLRELALLGAMFHYTIIPDAKPSFGEDGHCNNCQYVQPWFAEAPQ